MSERPKFERRDPCSPVLQLGTALAQARHNRDSGWLELMDNGRIHGVLIARGSIADVVSSHVDIEGAPIQEQMRLLFALSRPRVTWTSDNTCTTREAKADPMSVVLRGVLERREIFDPVQLVRRIPVNALQIDATHYSSLKQLPLASREIEFLKALQMPTPVPMILWKRGLDPHHAGALLMALNILGLWQGQWNPGDLPRVVSALQILRKKEQGATPYELLNIDTAATEQEQDRAFRKLSLELHPDRLLAMSESERSLSVQAFEEIGAAYQSLKISRRQRPVVAREETPLARVTLQRMRPDNWASLLVQARAAAEQGDLPRARAFALKAMTCTPPPGAQREIHAILTGAA